MKCNTDKIFARDFLGRIALGLASISLGPIFGMGAIGLLMHPFPNDWQELIFLILVEELLVALTIFFAAGAIWAIATPRWLENALNAITLKLLVALGLFMVPFTFVALYVIWLV